jgi:hypothetical protein
MEHLYQLTIRSCHDGHTQTLVLQHGHVMIFMLEYEESVVT